MVVHNVETVIRRIKNRLYQGRNILNPAVTNLIILNDLMSMASIDLKITDLYTDGHNINIYTTWHSIKTCTFIENPHREEIEVSSNFRSTNNPSLP
ncbi:hypothetical protein MAR_022509 [Mya arenaria]|uniref:Uncharacterized protein n=1 Tax=Mya arenaria TaxID=6604 RepID=A0ABY7DNG0_MYAAR|nr:hypothetical protein MAR_022509 [Mya arenaria]